MILTNYIYIVINYRSRSSQNEVFGICIISFRILNYIKNYRLYNKLRYEKAVANLNFNLIFNIMYNEYPLRTDDNVSQITFIFVF